MKKINICFLILFLLTGCASHKKIATDKDVVAAESTSIRDGLSFKTAIVIHEKSETKGVSAEYAWIREHYPGAQVNGQRLSNNNRKPYDIIKIVTAEGKNLDIYFDISNFFGKF